MFSNVKQNSRLTVVETGNNFKVYHVQVTETGKQTTVMSNQNQPLQVVSYIKATDGQQPFEFKELPVGNTVFTYADGTIVATSQEAMAAEMRRLNRNSREILASLPAHQQIVAGTEQVLEQIDNEYAEKKQMREQLQLLTKQNEELRKANDDQKKSNEEQAKANAEQAKAMKALMDEVKSLRNDVKATTSKK